jgi:hypothetical protein
LLTDRDENPRRGFDERARQRSRRTAPHGAGPEPLG